MPKWLLLRTATTPTPWASARATASLAGPIGDDLADAVVAVHDGDRAGVDDESRAGDGAS